MKLIDESYEMEEFESIRSYYQKVLYKLLSVAQSSKTTDKKALLQRGKYVLLQVDIFSVNKIY